MMASLPPKAALKLATLVDHEAAATALVDVTLRRIRDVEDQLIHVSDGPRASNLRAEVDRLNSMLSIQQARLAVAGQLLTGIRHWLSTLPANAVLTEAKPSKARPRDGEAPLAAVSRIRQTVYSLQLELRHVMRASVPKADMKAAVARHVTQLAARGEPKIRFDGDKVELNFADPASFTPKIQLATALAWLDAERLLEKLQAQIDALPEPQLALSTSEKETRIASIKQAILDTEFEEEAIISDADIDQVSTISRRPTADPRAVLSVVVASAARQVA